jgi:tetratricopeptide (TPR) repeat protein
MARGRLGPWLALAWLAGLIALAGCGKEALWARYRAERDLWHARKLVDRIRVNPRLASDRDYARAAGAFKDIVRRFPLSAWGRALPGPQRDVAVVAGNAAFSLAQLDDLRGAHRRAISEYAGVEREWRSFPSVAVAAAVARAESHERAGEETEAAAAWCDLARDGGLVDDETGQTRVPVLQAPVRAAGLLRRAGQDARADSVLNAAAARLTDELARRAGRPAAAGLWAALADVRGALGETAGALDALRAALQSGAPPADRPRLVQGMARLALDGSLPDTALIYARWARGISGPPGRAAAQQVIAEAWEVRGPADSALAAWQQVIDDNPQAPESAALARFRRGMLLERIDLWEQARSEYLALQAAQPTHALAFASMLRIVNHHARRGEGDLARLQGRQALDRIDEVMAGQHDETVALEAGLTRGRLLALLGRPDEAFDALSGLWRRAPGTPQGTAAGLEAAALADSALHDPVRARTLYEEVAARGGDESARRGAALARQRLRRAAG